MGKFAATEMGMFLLRQMLETRRKEVLSREEAIALLKEAMEVCIRIFFGEIGYFLKKVYRSSILFRCNYSIFNGNEI